MDRVLFSANNFKKIADLKGKKLHLGSNICVREIPLIAQLVEQRTVVRDQNLKVIFRSLVQIQLSGCRTVFC